VLKTGIRRMCVPQRAMLYRLAAGTGFRLSELKSLTPRSFNLDADTPTVTVEAAYSKRRRQDVQPMRLDLAEVLRPFLATLDAEECIWAKVPSNMAPIIRADLETAGIDPVDDAGRVIDFHSLRHTYITRLATAGVPPRVAQSLARHSTITLTMDRYSHVRLADESAALEALPSITEPAELAATGTAGRTAQRIAQRAAISTVLSGAECGTADRSPHAHRGARGNDRKPLALSQLSDPVQQDAQRCAGELERATRGTRTPDLCFTKAPVG